MAQKQIEESIEILEKEWEIDSVLRDFILGKRTDVSDFAVTVKDVIFHIPFLLNEK
jgi:hypothetical protein